MADRGAFSTLEFRRCERGFALFASPGAGLVGEMYAFDHIADLAKWLVDQYGDPQPTPEDMLRKFDPMQRCIKVGD